MTKRWPLKKAYFWETAPFFRVLPPFAAGILCYDMGWLPIFNSVALVALVCIASLLYCLAVNTRFVPGRIVPFVLLCVTMFSGGVAVCYYDDVRNDPAWFGRNVDVNSTYLVQVSGAPAEKEHSWKVPVTVTATITNGKASMVTGPAFVYVYKDDAAMTLRTGDALLVPGDWQQIKNTGNPFAFDYVTYCRRSGVVYQQFCAQDDIKVYATRDTAAIPMTERAYNWCMQQLDRNIPEPKAKGLIQAMILGNVANLDEDIRQSYADTGIIHIIAISGGNVSIFFIVISFLLWWLRHKKYLWVKFVIALPLVWFYVLMAGAAPSAVRAAVMFSLLAGTKIFDKSSNSLNQLLVTAFVLLCAQPEWLFSTGFQLSFVAVLSLILFYTPVYRWLSPVNRPARLLWETVAASIAAEVLVAPLVVYYFHTFPLLFVVANAAAYVFMSIVLVLGIAIIFTSFIPALAKGIGILVVYLVTAFDNIVTWLQHFSPASFHSLLLNGVELCLVYVMLAGIVVYVMKVNKKALFTGLTAGCVLAVSFCIDEWQHLHQQRLVVYNTPKTIRAELVRGADYKQLTSDLTDKKAERTLQAAHISWQALEQDAGPADLFMLGGKKVLVLNKEVNSENRFPVDVVVVNYTGRVDMERMQKVFGPQTVVVGNNYSERRQEQWVTAGNGTGMAIHAVALQGAYVLE